jgi:crotonobetainyl-CoA:carnitine CoA-transferase CaiB-like acyl-CoA transferase
VVDFSWGLAGALTSLLLADFGAEVLKVEPPGGDPLRLAPGFYLWGRGKRSAILDLHRPEERARAADLAASADVLLHTFRRPAAARFGLTYAELAGRNPGLIACRTGGAGLTGRYADVKGYEGVVAAKIGLFQPNRDLALRDGPVYVTTPAGSYSAAQLALQGVLAALYERNRSGLGQEVETSLLHGLTTYDTIEGLFYYLRARSGGGRAALRRFSERGVPLQGSGYTLMCAPSKDGYWFQFANIGGPPMWNAFLDVLDLGWTREHPDFREALSAPPPLGPAFTDEAAAARFWDLILERLRARTLAEWLDVFLREDNLGVEVFYTTQDALDHPQLRLTGQVTTLEDPRVGPIRMLGPLAVMEATPAAIGKPAPDLTPRPPSLRGKGVPGSDASFGPQPRVFQNDSEVGTLFPRREGGRGVRSAPLAGVLAIELATYFAAPFGLTLLAELGARVIKVEPLSGDPLRHQMPIPDTGGVKVIQGKESLAVDLETEEGRAIVYTIAEKADLALCSWRAGMAERLGVDDATLRARNPRLIYVYGTSYGREGPYARRPAYAPSATAGAGLADYQGGPEVPPPAGTPLDLEAVKRLSGRVRAANGFMTNGDTSAALMVGTALLLGLCARERTGEGQRITTTMLASNGLVASDDFLAYAGKPPRRLPDRDFCGMGPLYRLYETGEGWIFLACPQEKEWAPLCAALAEATGGRLDLGADPRFADTGARAENADALAAALAGVFRERRAGEWEDFLLARDLAGVALNPRPYLEVLFDDPLLRENDLIREVEHPKFGRHPRTGPTIRLSRSATRTGPAATVGQHTRAILGELGYTEAQIEDLVARRVVAVSA